MKKTIVETQDEAGRVYHSLQYYQDSQILHSIWQGEYLSIEQMAQSCAYVLTSLKEHQVPHLLHDNAKLEGVWEDTQEWLAEVWIPKAVEAGLRKLAHLLSDNVFALASGVCMIESVQKHNYPIEIQLFNDHRSAFQWLNGLKPIYF